MLTIGTVSLTGNLILAPLAGYSDLPFRLLCHEYGASLCVSEMISCHGLVYRQKKTIEMARSCDDERPLSLQIFGAEPDIMGEAAAILDSFSPDMIDINMGCPVKKVTKRGAGAALMTDPYRAEQIISTVVKNCHCPVTVKMRSGPDSNTINCTQFASIAEACGAAAVTIHGRTWKQGFNGCSDWNQVRRVKQQVAIPVIGNGDITSFNQIDKKIKETGCDGIMIGRGALGNPWIFSKTHKPSHPSLIARCASRHISLVESFFPYHQQRLALIKNHLGRYFRDFNGASTIRKKLYDCSDWSSLKAVISSVEND